jgi:uncharacterized OB-fold protein
VTAPEDEPFRLPPLLTDLNREFWTSGASGTLRILRCGQCRRFLHPPTPVCRYCHADTTAYEPVSGNGTVASFSVNHQQWAPHATKDPYVVALVQLDEQDDLRIITNIVNCPVDEVRIGMPVRVTFRAFEDVTLPLFEPAGA